MVQGYAVTPPVTGVHCAEESYRDLLKDVTTLVKCRNMLRRYTPRDEYRRVIIIRRGAMRGAPCTVYEDRAVTRDVTSLMFTWHVDVKHLAERSAAVLC